MLKYLKIMPIYFSTYRWFKEGLILGFYVFWLISFPLEGHLLLESGISTINYFIVPHIVALFVSTSSIRLLRDHTWNKISIICIIIVILATILFPFLISYKHILLIFIGFLSAPIVLRTLSILSMSANTPLSIGIGLAAGNLFVAILSFLPIDAHLKFLTIALALLPTIFIKIVNNIKDVGLSDLKLRLPFIFFFYLIGGLLYGFLMSEYKKISIIDNLELAFYIVFALVSAYSIKKNKEFTFASGIFYVCLLSLFLKQAIHI